MRQQSISLFHARVAPAARPAEVPQRAEWGRKAILCGCIMTLVGMVAYCYGTVAVGPDADLPSALFQNGILGWAAFVLLVTGVGIWMAGNVALLAEADRVPSKR